MNDPTMHDPALTHIEELLRRDRAAASLPEAPDVRYTVAAVRLKLGPDGSTDWPLLLLAAATLLVGAGVALTQGLNPWWLLALPLSVLPLFPILMRKGV